MNKNSNSLQGKLALLRQSYRNQLPDKISEFDEAVILSANSSDADIRSYLERLAGLSHKLAGSGATFGFPDISDAARSLEQGCEEILTQCPSSVQAVTDAIGPMISVLRKVIGDVLAVKTSKQADVEDVAQHNETKKVLVIISDDNEEMGRLANELEKSGFALRLVKPDNDLESNIQQMKPAAIIAETSFDWKKEPSLPDIGLLREKGIFDGPLIVISDSGEIHVRLQAARNNADAFMMKPVAASDLVDVLDQNLFSEGVEDYRILIVDDDVTTAKYTRLILQEAGMVAKIVTDPMVVMEKLDEFRPELILMDLYMPQCSGQELAFVVRQRESYSAVPIVFLSGEDDIDTQLLAMRSGGDDFLTKPIKTQHLISSVRMRVRRFRMLRSRMVRDSMTGLLNHTATHEFLDNELARAHRNNSILSVAVLDIDHFKSVNDVHGHAVGDQVIKSLSWLLRQRLRSNDVIGRMGGEEFAAVLAGTPVQEAEKIFNGIRQAFSEIEHSSGEGKFSVTFSCGISAYPMHETSAMLLKAADMALYKAKNEGRNRVVVDAD